MGSTVGLGKGSVVRRAAALIPYLTDMGGDTFHFGKNQSATLENPFVLGKIKFPALRIHFRATKAPFFRKFPLSHPPGWSVGHGLKYGMAALRDA